MSEKSSTSIRLMSDGIFPDRAIISSGSTSNAWAIFVEKSRWPDENETAEQAVRASLADLVESPHRTLCDGIMELEERHGQRRGWIWARLGLAPLAEVLEPLAEIARHVNATIGGSTPDDVASTYVSNHWRADAASLRAIALAPTRDEQLVGQVVASLMGPWLDDSSRAFQVAAASSPLPVCDTVKNVSVPTSTCLLFADGLRYDLGRQLAERLEANGCRVDVQYRWAALPTVTATAKPAVTPVANRIEGATLPEDFCPYFKADQSATTAARLRTDLESRGYQIIGGSLDEWPSSDESRGWIEAGQIDRIGHKLGIELARHLVDELDRLANAVLRLLDAGWATVRVVTDHGWLLLPGGLPKIDLPKHLTESRWARCAVISGGSQVDVPTWPWYWNPTQYFAAAPGIACFNRSLEYAHGGVSIQECLIPDLTVEKATEGAVRATVRSVTWKGMRAFVEAEVSAADVTADLRLRAPAGESVAATVKELDQDGTVSLLLADDSYEAEQLVIVLLAFDGSVIAQRKTKVGETT